MKNSLKVKLAMLGAPIAAALTAVAAKAADITLTASTTDVTEVTGPLQTLMISIWRGPVAQLLGFGLVFAAVVAVYHMIKSFLGRRKKARA